MTYTATDTGFGSVGNLSVATMKKYEHYMQTETDLHP